MKPPKIHRRPVTPELMREFVSDDFEILLAVLEVPSTPMAVLEVATIVVGVMTEHLLKLGLPVRKIASAFSVATRHEGEAAAKATTVLLPLPPPTRPDRGR